MLCFKLYVNTNYLPVITDTTLFTSGRVLIIPFDKHFEEWEQDKGLKAEFGKPEVQSAILYPVLYPVFADRLFDGFSYHVPRVIIILCVDLSGHVG